METSSSWIGTLGRTGWYKYGMLGFILMLALVNVLVYARTSPNARPGAVGNLVVTAMLLVNHVSSVFLSERWQRRVIIPQFVFIGAGLLYMLSTLRR